MTKVLMYGSIYSETGKKKKWKNAEEKTGNLDRETKTDSLNLSILYFPNSYLYVSWDWKVAI